MVTTKNKKTGIRYVTVKLLVKKKHNSKGNKKIVKKKKKAEYTENAK